MVQEMRKDGRRDDRNRMGKRRRQKGTVKVKVGGVSILFIPVIQFVFI